jgi:hypothetical protein
MTYDSEPMFAKAADENHEPSDQVAEVESTDPRSTGESPTAEPERPRESVADGAYGPPVNQVPGSTWHAVAGRKGARRLRELIQEGQLYEQKHGLRRGRQRIRQLIQQGKLYEQERGLRPGRRSVRSPRMSSEQTVKALLQLLVRIARPPFQPELERLVRAMDQE